jgi:hypothetical protein
MEYYSAALLYSIPFPAINPCKVTTESSWSLATLQKAKVMRPNVAAFGDIVNIWSQRGSASLRSRLMKNILETSLVSKAKLKAKNRIRVRVFSASASKKRPSVDPVKAGDEKTIPRPRPHTATGGKREYLRSTEYRDCKEP